METHLDHLADACCLGRNPLMAMFTAYFDASGDPSKTVITMAGFVSRKAKWTRFESEWIQLLPLGLRSFHMTDFVSSRRGWEPWKTGHSADRARLMEALVACIKRNTNKGFGVSLCLGDYAEVNSRYQLEEASGGPYSVVGMACLGKLGKWACRRKLNHHRILCSFEKGDCDQGRFFDRAWKEHFEAIPQSKKNVRAFDACDLAAWKVRTIADETWVRELQLEDPLVADRIIKTLQQLDPILQLNEVVGHANLLEMCIQLGIPARS